MLLNVNSLGYLACPNLDMRKSNVMTIMSSNHNQHSCIDFTFSDCIQWDTQILVSSSSTPLRPKTTTRNESVNSTRFFLKTNRPKIINYLYLLKSGSFLTMLTRTLLSIGVVVVWIALSSINIHLLAG